MNKFLVFTLSFSIYLIGQSSVIMVYSVEKYSLVFWFVKIVELCLISFPVYSYWHDWVSKKINEREESKSINNQL